MFVTATIGIVALVIVVMMFMLVMFVTAAIGIVALVFVVMMFVSMMFVTAAIGIVALVLVVMMFVLVMTMMMLMLHFVGKSVKLRLQTILLLHSGKNCFAVKAIPYCRYNRCRTILFFEHCHRRSKLVFRRFIRMRKNDTTCIFYLIVEKFAEILHIHLAFRRVYNRTECVEYAAVNICVFYCLDNVAKFADARRLDDDPIGGIFRRHLLKRFCKITNKRTANAPRIHFGDVNARFLQKSAVNTDFTKFVFNQNNFFACIGFLDELFNQSGFPCTKESRKNINLHHKSLQKYSLRYI